MVSIFFYVHPCLGKMNPFGLIFFQMGLVQPPTNGYELDFPLTRGHTYLTAAPLRTKYAGFLDDIVAGGRVKMDFYEAWTRWVWVIFRADLGWFGGCLVPEKMGWKKCRGHFGNVGEYVKMKNLLAGKNDIKDMILQLGHAWWWANGNGWRANEEQGEGSAPTR